MDMKFFDYEHLPPQLQAVSKDIHKVALIIHSGLPESEEKTAGMRKLLEAKDCFIRSIMEKQTRTEDSIGFSMVLRTAETLQTQEGQDIVRCKVFLNSNPEIITGFTHYYEWGQQASIHDLPSLLAKQANSVMIALQEKEKRA